MSHKNRCPNFVKLMTQHLQGAGKVIKGNIYESKGKKLIQNGLKMLKKNTENWHRAMVHVTESEVEGLKFKHLWEEHVALEGQYIEAVFHCHCKTKDFGQCNSAQAAKEAIEGLSTNGAAVTEWFSDHLSESHRQQWTDYWIIHLQCVKDTIDTGKLVKCKFRTLKDFRERAKHCIKLGQDLGHLLNTVHHCE